MKHYKGLNNKQVSESREKWGSNIISPPKREGWFKLLLKKFNDPLIKILLVAATISILINILDKHTSIIESLGIILAILIATIVSFINEYKANKEFDIVNKINDETLVKVIRDINDESVVVELPKVDIVVGDYIIISAGDEIPADGHLLDSIDLKVNESSLNGESEPAKKTHIESTNYNTAYSPNKLYRGTTVSEGEGVYMVDFVGDDTEIGKTAKQATEVVKIKTPLQLQLEKLGKQIGLIGLLVAGLTFIVLLITAILKKEIITPLFDVANLTTNILIIVEFFMVAITLVVMAVPEGLPMSITLSMAYSMRKMAKSHTLIRKLDACETMGATTVICTDKTGTLTLNKMSVVFISNKLSDSVALDIANNTTAFLNGDEVIGNQTEGALLLHLKSEGYNYKELRDNAQIIKRIPFSSTIKYMATLYTSNGVIRLAIKGAPEIVLSKCSNVDASSIIKEISKYQSKGLRALVMCSKVIDSKFIDTNNIDSITEELITKGEFTLDSYVALEDPIRSDVPYSMEMCNSAGVNVKIITGDTSLTAITIAKESGLWRDGDTLEKNSITGYDFENISDEQAIKILPDIKVMSRAKPADKMRLVRLLQSMGEIVAVTGDGTNDAPALNYANVGLAMGSGTSTAKESSDIILLNNSFTSVVSAIKWGRTIYRNIQKFIVFQLTVNVAALLTALLGPFFGIELPLTVTQILWINLIMDTLAAIALATELPSENIMNERPRNIKDSIITKKMFKNILIFGISFFILSFLVLLIEQIFVNDGNLFSLENLTIFFTFFVMLQLWNMLNIKVFPKRESSLLSLTKNKAFLIIFLTIFILQIIIVNFGGVVMRTTPISFKSWIVLILVTSPVFIIPEIYRVVKSKNK